MIVKLVVKVLTIIVHGQQNVLALEILLSLDYFWLVFLFLFAILEFRRYGLIRNIINVELIFFKSIKIFI